MAPVVVAVHHRTRFLIAAVTFFHVGLMLTQVQAKPGVTLLESLVFGCVSQLQRGTAALAGGVNGVWKGYLDLRGLRDENAELRRRLADVEVQMQEARAQAKRGERLALLLGLRAALPQATLPADVIAADATPWFSTVTINRGASDGVVRDLAVISPRGVVGRVLATPAAHAARVQVIVDPTAAVGATIERSRAGGVVVGGEDRRLRLEFVPALADVRVGDTVVTSGLDGIYPKGYVIGRVETVRRDANGYAHIGVQPSVDFSALEELLVVLTPQAGVKGAE